MGAEPSKPAARRAPLELLAIAAGLVSAAALAWAGLALVRDPDQAGRAGLARLAGEVADGVLAEFRRQGGLPPVFVGEPVAWTPGEDDALVLREARDVTLLAAPGGETFDALLAEARRLEVRESRPAEALDVVRRALETTEDPARVAAGRLRAVQLAARLQLADEARTHWRVLSATLTGDETLEEVPVLLLAGLAVAPLLAADERAALVEDLTARWCDGRLALPAPRDEYTYVPTPPPLVPPRREVLRRRLVELGGTGDDPRWALDARRRQVAAFDRVLGGVPQPAPGGAPWIHVGAPHFACVLRPDGTVQGGFFDPRACVAAWRMAGWHGRPAFSDLLPAGFALAFDGEHVSAGEQIRERTPLLGEALGFTLWHSDPAAFGAAESRRAAWLRAGLLGTAAFSLLAGLLTARLLARARALSALRAAFVAGVSHELRTPVSSILLLTENLQSGVAGTPEARARYLDLVRREALRLRRLVEDVLDVSRLERGLPLRLRREEVALPAFAADLARELQAVATRAGVTLHARVGPLPEGAALDAEALRRAVGNLVDNALKHGGGGDVDLDIECTEDGAGPPARLRLRVRDRGPGIPPRDRQRVFLPFERLGDGAAGGSGLGLAIVREIAEGHGGHVRVEDPPDGPGACLVIELPLTSGEVPA